MNIKNSPPPSASIIAEGNIKAVWAELHSRFAFPLDLWKKRFDEYCKKSLIKDRVEGFYRFGNDVINPLLNEILCRRSGYPTFLNLVDYVIKKKA